MKKIKEKKVKKLKQRKKKKKVKPIQDNHFDFGSREFTCISCGLTFEVPWIDIFELQECTHGYVGEYLNNEYIACPDCGENSNDEYCGDIDDPIGDITNLDIEDDYLPF